MSVKENDLLGYWFPTDWTLNDLISTQLTGAMATQEDTVLPAIHAYLTLCLRERGREREGGRERGREGERGRDEGERKKTEH